MAIPAERDAFPHTALPKVAVSSATPALWENNGKKTAVPTSGRATQIEPHTHGKISSTTLGTFCFHTHFELMSREMKMANSNTPKSESEKQLAHEAEMNRARDQERARSDGAGAEDREKRQRATNPALMPKGDPASMA